MKTYLGEITNSSNQARAFGLIGLMWGLGGVVGSLVGGVCARPATKWPSVFGPEGPLSIFADYPYLLPNLIASSATFVGLIVTIIYLKENVIVYQRLKNMDYDADEDEVNENGGNVELEEIDEVGTIVIENDDDDEEGEDSEDDSITIPNNTEREDTQTLDLSNSISSQMKEQIQQSELPKMPSMAAIPTTTMRMDSDVNLPEQGESGKLEIDGGSPFSQKKKPKSKFKIGKQKNHKYAKLQKV